MGLKCPEEKGKKNKTTKNKNKSQFNFFFFKSGGGREAQSHRLNPNAPKLGHALQKARWPPGVAQQNRKPGQFPVRRHDSSVAGCLRRRFKDHPGTGKKLSARKSAHKQQVRRHVVIMQTGNEAPGNCKQTVSFTRPRRSRRAFTFALELSLT